MTKNRVLKPKNELVKTNINFSEFTKNEINNYKKPSKQGAKRVWDDKLIRVAIAKFIIENGRPPFAKELDLVDYLPSHEVIKTAYNCSAGYWLIQNYPTEKNTEYAHNYNSVSNSTAIQLFIKEYNKIKPTSALNYNRKRNKIAPGWQKTCKLVGVKKWSELKERLNLCTYYPESPEDEEVKIQWIVNSRIL